MKISEQDIQGDISVINSIPVVPVILESICRTTGMGFAAVARVTDERWIACSVLDEVKFGLVAGSELKLETTICHEIRQSGNLVVIDHVKDDELYYNHHTPNMYGLQSYISVPILRERDGFFGTLCAVDSRPALLNTPEIINMFKAYAGLISFYLNAAGQLPPEPTKTLEQRVHTAISAYTDAISAQFPVQLTATLNTRDARFNGMIHELTDRINTLVKQLKS